MQRLALIAWLVAAGVALTFKLNGQLIHMLAGAIISALILYGGMMVLNRQGLEPAG